jgi:hypothetical protein
MVPCKPLRWNIQWAHWTLLHETLCCRLSEKKDQAADHPVTFTSQREDLCLPGAVSACAISEAVLPHTEYPDMPSSQSSRPRAALPTRYTFHRARRFSPKDRLNATANADLLNRDAAFYDDCHCRRRRDVGDSRPQPRSLTPKELSWRSLESPNVTGSIGGAVRRADGASARPSSGATSHRWPSARRGCSYLFLRANQANGAKRSRLPSAPF